MARHRSSATPLALAYAALIVYASLYPFSGWQIGVVQSPAEWLKLPWPRWWTGFDAWSNLLGYLPLGALLFIALVRSGLHPLKAGLLGMLAGALLSLGMELLQTFLPLRVPSRMDWLLNLAGTLVGVLIAALLYRTGWVDRWQAMRERWFIDRSAGALALVLLWPIGLLFPAPVPLGLGQAIVRLPELLLGLVEGTGAEPWFAELADRAAANEFLALSPAAEAATITLGLLAPCLLAMSVTRRGWRRVLVPLLAALVGFAATTLSTALSFGPEHMLAWQTDAVAPAFAIAVAAALMAAWLPGRAVAALGLIALTALLVLVAHAPSDPYYAESLQAWEQGRFIRFHGVAQWIGWLWPYTALLYLLVRLGFRETP